MTLDTIRQVLLYSFLINYGILILWFVLLAFPHAWMYRLWGRFFKLSEERFDAINLAGIVFYKIAILFFNLVPYAALRIVG